MRHELEKEIVLPNVTVELATISWSTASRSPVHASHALFQRLSRNHSPLRLGNLSALDLLPRFQSVGFLPAGSSVPLEPIEKPLRVLTCFYDPDYVSRQTGLERERLDRHIAALASLRNMRLEILMQDLHAELEQPGLAHELLMASIADMLLVEITRLVARLERKKPGRGVILALAPWQLLRIEERIKASATKGYPSLGELAQMCSVSEGHLARAFKASTGWQIHKYIAEQRIKAACDLLKQGGLGIEEVARQLGFSSASYFATAFRRKTGKTPSDFRRQALTDSAGAGAERS